jgi:phosphatidylinositol alpha-1,6-mannosyltransferase
LTPALDGADGISEVSRQVVSALARDAHTPDALEVWALDGGEPEKSPTATSARFRLARGNRARLAGWALARARADAGGLLIVVMHVHLAPVALPLALRGARSAIFLHGLESWHRLRARERAAVDRAAVLMAASCFTARRFKEANSEFHSADIRVCQLGVSHSRPTPVAPRHRQYALIVGRLAAEERYKGHDALIRVWPSVRETVPSAELVIVGDGNDRARLEALAAAQPIGKAVHFAGRVSSAELEGYYRHAAFFIMPSTGEGFGLAYLEAMRAGKACIAAPGAAEELVRDGVTGLIVDPSSPRALAEAVIRMFREPDTCAAMGRAGAERVGQEFTQRHFEDRVRAALAEANVVA